MAREWHTQRGTRTEGPFSSRQLAERAAAGQLLPTDRVSLDRTNWVPASKVKGLKFHESALKHTVHVSPPDEPSSTEPGPDVPLEQVPGYDLAGILGEGGMGVVYRARHLKLDRVVALKTVAAGFANQPAVAARFEKEAMALARLQHPNIVQVYDAGRAGDRLYFAMELLAGEDLDRLIDRQGRLDERTAWLIARQTAAALAHAAARDITHRDIKPANLFVVPPPLGSDLPPGVPMVKVTDFGLALTRGSVDNRLTTTGTVLGTPVYMAPEQFKTSSLDHRADIYSLGASVFHMLAGQVPFLEPTVWELMLAKTQPSPRLTAPVSPESIELVAAMMALEPADRPQTYEDLLARIDQLPCLASSTKSYSRPALPPPRSVRSRRRALIAAGAGLGLGLALGLGYLVFGGRGSTDTPTLPTATTRYEPTGVSTLLYQAGSVVDWQGPGWGIEQDDNDEPVLAGSDRVRRVYPVHPNFRITMAIDLQKAQAVELTFITPADPAQPRTVLRLTPETGSTIGTRLGDSGPLQDPTPPIPLLPGKTYREVRFEKAGPVWRVFVEGAVIGTVPDDGRPRIPEFRLLITNGPIRIESASLDELRESS